MNLLAFNNPSPANEQYNRDLANYSDTPLLHHSARPDSRTTTRTRTKRFVSVLAVVLGLFVTVDPSVAQTARYVQVQNNAGQVILTRWALQHIMARHWPDSPATGAGKFQEGTTEASLRDMINEAVRGGRSRQNTHGRPGTIYEYDFHHQIGTTIDGGSATRLRVVVNNRNEVVTAFPF